MATNQRTEQAVQAARLVLERYVSSANREMAAAWSAAWQELTDEFAAAVDVLVRMGEDGEWPSRAAVRRSQRAANALKAAADAIDELADGAGVTIVGRLRDVVDHSTDVQRIIAATQLPEQFGVDWSRVDEKALRAIVDRTSKRVESATRPLPALTQQRMKAVLVRGIALGDNPNAAARLMLDRCHGVFDGGLARARTIARTEMLDAHRESARLTRMENADTLKGWRWHCTLSDRTCPSCLAQSGSLHPLDEQGPLDHQNGRCTAVPVAKTWRDLGIDLDEPEEEFQDARGWYEQQDRATQETVMGPERAARLRDGRLTWDDLSQRVETPGWRASYRVAPLA